jgi:predicted alpha-1,6-mannanase (GH76 family)
VQLNIAEPAPDNSYLAKASTIAKAAIGALADPTTHVLHEICDKPNNCSKDETQFKGIFMRNLAHLQQVAPDNDIAAFITANADSIWANARSQTNTFAVNWSGPDANQDNASTTSSALDAIVAAAAIQPH